jgi:hypothetical protein
MREWGLPTLLDKRRGFIYTKEVSSCHDIQMEKMLHKMIILSV